MVLRTKILPGTSSRSAMLGAWWLRLLGTIRRMGEGAACHAQTPLRRASRATSPEAGRIA